MKIGNLQLLEYNISEIKKTLDFTIKEIANDITFINQSVGFDLYINNTVVVPGQEFNTGGNYGEIINQNFNCRFQDTGGGTSKNCIILLKTYKHITP